MFNFFRWSTNMFVSVTLWAYKKTLKAAQKRIERNNKIIAAMSAEIVELENDSEVMKEYLGQAKVTVTE